MFGCRSLFAAAAAASVLVFQFGCSTNGNDAAEDMPLAGARIVAADEFWAERPQVKWPPTVLRQTDANGREVYWGLAAAQDLTNALGKVLGMAVPLYRESEAPAGEGPVVYLGPVSAATALLWLFEVRMISSGFVFFSIHSHSST